MQEGMRASLPALLLAGLMLLAATSGCLSSLTDDGASDGSDVSYPSIWERHTLDWQTNNTFSFLLEPGPHEALDVQEAFIEVDTSEVWDVGPAVSTVHLSYWLPSNTLEGEAVPVIAVMSPYFSYGQPGDESTPTNVVGAGRGEFIFHNFVPHGYAFAQVSVFGTELSTGCFDYRGLGEGLGIHHAVEWLGSQEWSNGNVGMYGKSYEGATQWEAAAMGSEHLRTIVPISGTTALHPLLYKNGSAEARSQVMHMNYFSSTVDYDEDDLDNVCPDIAEGLFAGPVTYIGGEMDPYMQNYYDDRSHIDKAFGNWNGSVYWIQGMQDWNVDPHQVFGGPAGVNWYQHYVDAGFDVRGMIGQWGHHYPDQVSSHDGVSSGNGLEARHNMTRWDWAQDLFEWFEYYLKDKGPKPDLTVQIQRSDGEWRIEETWPPTDVQWLDVPMGECTNMGNNWVGGAPVIGGISEVVVECPPFDEDVLIAGLVRLHLLASAVFDGGQVFVEMQDSATGTRIGHATMDIRYHEGGNEPTGVIPGETVTMMMEFQGIDHLLLSGSGIKLVMTTSGKDYLAPACGAACPVHVHITDDSVLSLPLIDRDGSNVLITHQRE